MRSIVALVIRVATLKACVTVTECSATLLDQIVNGFEKEPLENEDLIRIGRRVLGASI